MNTFAYIGSIRDKPIVKCVYQTDVNENKFIIKGDGQAEDGGVGICLLYTSDAADES